MSQQTHTAMLNAIAAHLSDENDDRVLLDAVEIRVLEAPSSGTHVPRTLIHWAKDERSALLVAAPYSTRGANDVRLAPYYPRETR